MMMGGVLWLFPVLCFGFYGMTKKEFFEERGCYCLVWLLQNACDYIQKAIRDCTW